MENTLTTITHLFKADISELESVATYYTELLSDMERLETNNGADDTAKEDGEVTMFTSRLSTKGTTDET